MSALPRPLTVLLRPMEEKDVPEVIEIERQAYAYPQTKGIMIDCLRVGYSARVLEYQRLVGAYGFMSVAAGEAHLLNLCVKPRWQGMGFGRTLLAHLVEDAATRAAEVVFLEVRPSNQAGLIGKWLKAGVLEPEVEVIHPVTGSPQGGERSPMLANTFLDHVLDDWFEREVKPRMKGRCLLLRCADDCVIGCEREDDARRMLVVLPKRGARFQRTMHPQKTRLVRFQPPRHQDEGARGHGTFDLLGLTHDWAKSRRGYGVITRRTAKKRLRRAMRAVWHWCRTHRHDPLRDQSRVLCPKLRGHYQYDGIRGNDRKLEARSRWVERAWRQWLSRRGGPRTIRWETFAHLRAVLALPLPRIVHNI